jgi:hypothetical protein
VRVAYRIDLGTADGLFVARQMAVREGDLVYVANAESVQNAKLWNLISPFRTTGVATVQSGP